MKVLLDTHVFLWWINDDSRLSQNVRQIISDSANELFLSAVSGWEIAIKSRLGRLDLPGNLEGFISEQIAFNAMQSLPVKMSHALHTYSLPLLHRDPFDRMLVSQSQLERLPILTMDTQIAAYDVDVLWD